MHLPRPPTFSLWVKGMSLTYGTTVKPGLDRGIHYCQYFFFGIVDSNVSLKIGLFERSHTPALFSSRVRERHPD